MIDQILTSEAATFSLEGARVSGVVVAAPLAWTAAPAKARVALIVGLTFVVHGASGTRGAVVPDSGAPLGMALALGSELALGLSIGFVVRLAFAAVEIASDAAAPMIGVGAAQIFDPQAQSASNLLGSLLRNFAMLIALAIGLHRIVIGELLGSFRWIAPGQAMALPGPAPMMLALSAEALTTGVRIAMPLIAVLLLLQVALAFISRAAPAMQIFSIGFTATLLVGIGLLFLIIPDLAEVFAADASHVAARIEGVLASMGAGRGSP